MSSTKRFFLVYVSLIAIANSVHADQGAAGSNGATGMIRAVFDGIKGLNGNQDPNMIQGGGLMNLNGGFGQQGMMQNGMQPVNFQGIPGMNQGGAMAGFPGQQQQIPGSPMMINGQQVVDPNTGQAVLVPQPGTMTPGTPMLGANGQPIINPMTGEQVLVPQPVVQGIPLSGGAMAGFGGQQQQIPGTSMPGANGQPIIDPATGQPVFVPQPGGQGMAAGGVLAGVIDESVLMDPRLNPPLYEKIMAEAQADPNLMQALNHVKMELNAQHAKIVRAALLKPILLRMNLSQAQEAQALQAQQMQQQQAMTQASAAARRAEEQRIRTIEVEISRLEQENNQIMADLKRQGVSQEEINSIVSRSRQDAVRVAGNAGPLAGSPQMPGAIGTPAFGTPPAMNPNAITPLGAPQSGNFGRPQSQGGLPSFPGIGGPQAGAPKAGGLPSFPGIGGPQAGAPKAGGLPSFPGIGGPQAGGAPKAGGMPSLPGIGGPQAGAPKAGGLPQMAF